MSTNYYIIDKIKLKQDRMQRQLLEQIDRAEIEKELNELVLKHYDAVLKYLEETANESRVENFKSMLNTEAERFDSNLRNFLDYWLLTRLDQLKHIGKSSAGWLFCFHYQPEWKNYEEFERYILTELDKNGLTIINEYWEDVSPQELIETIQTKQKDDICLNNPDNFTYNDNVNGYRFANGEWN